MKMTQNQVEEYIDSEICPKFPAIFKKVHISSRIVSRGNYVDSQSLSHTIELPKYGNIIKCQNKLYKPICNED